MTLKVRSEKTLEGDGGLYQITQIKMIIGKRNLSEDELREAIETRASLSKFIRMSVPPVLRHIPQIINNQKYITALQIRKLEGVKFNHKMNVVNELVESLTLQGSINEAYTLEDILVEVDFDKLLKALFEDELNAYERSLKNDKS